MTFPQTPLDVRSELQIGGTWTDASTDVYTRAPITITRGAPDEATGLEPSTCSLTMNNRHGKYSPRNPMSPYYGLIGRNTPLRVSVQGPESYLSLDGSTTSYARTPDVAALDIVGDIDLRVEATVDWHSTASQTLLGKWISATNQRSYLLRLLDGVLILNWSATGSASLFAQQPLPALPKRAALRATLDVNTGGGSFGATFYWAESMAGPWTQIGDPLTGPATSIFASTAPLEIAPIAATGVTPVFGRVHRAEVRSGIGGTVVASPDIRALAEGATGWTDSAGRIWTLGADAHISDRQYRFHGEVSAWPSRWDVSGKDVYVSVEAAGITRRMGQGKKALDSTLRRRIPSDPDLIAYWPMEDGAEATAAYSPLPGVAPLTVTGFEFGADDSLGGAASLPRVGSPATMRGSVPRSTASGWQVEYVYLLPTMPALQTEMVRVAVAGSVMKAAVVYASTAGVRIEAQGSDGTVLAFFTYTDAGALADFSTTWNRLAIYTADDGGTCRLYVSWRNILDGGLWIARTGFVGVQGAVTEVSGSWGSGTADMTLGHLAVFDIPATSAALTAPPGSGIFAGADDGFLGETAIERLGRLATEEAAQVDLSWRGEDFTTPTERMGPQRPATLLDLIEEAAETDGGILYEHADRTGLVYRDRQSLYNQAVGLALDYTAEGEVPPPLEPTPDDQRTRNDITVTRRGGSSGRAVLESGPLSIQPPPNGVGLYDEAFTLSLYNDDQPPGIAQWRMHLGTWDEDRYPTITVWLHAAPHLVDDVLDLDIGDRITISNPPAWLPPGTIDQHMRGYTEVLDQFEWTLTMNCVPAGPWTVGVVEDPILGRADTDGSELAAAVTSSDTTWQVAVTDGPAWITTSGQPTEFPVDVTAGGEQVTVTGITGKVEDTFTRTVSNSWGTATTGQTWITTGGSASDRQVNGTAGTVSLPASPGTWRIQRAGQSLADCETLVRFSMAQVHTGASFDFCSMLRWVSDTDFYVVRASFTTSGTVQMRIFTNDDGTPGGTVTTPWTYTAGANFYLRARVDGQRIRGRVWPVSAREPDSWDVDQVAAATPNASGDVGILCFGGAGLTSANPTAAVADFVVVNPQTFTVVRSVNGISKAHSAGASLSLTHPMRAAH
ncbi:hypothetical protein [Streptomyces sp. NPDC058620]|uniref:hypothetical protein n=1 Tax=Streptomyces sp. NPDC058620 TaxID=3346560 RepID=UPI00364D4BC3